ncbi:MAG: hypothetical protein AAB221_12585, partial [Bacteroidota bacterium]
MAGVPHGGNLWKNIAITIATTVAAYLIVHFITDKKYSNKKKKEKAEANKSAWESVNDYTQNMALKFESIACFSCDYTKMKNEIARELDQSCNSLRNLKDGDLIDEKMKTIIDRNISRFNSLKPLLQSFFDSAIVLKTITDTAEKVKRGAAVHEEFTSSKTRIDTVDQREIDRLLADLNKKYNLALKEEPIELGKNLSLLPGKWNIECVVTVEFRKDGSLTWTEEENIFEGSWQRKDDILTIRLDTEQEFIYRIAELNNSFMKLEVAGSSIPLGACRKQS